MEVHLIIQIIDSFYGILYLCKEKDKHNGMCICFYPPIFSQRKRYNNQSLPSFVGLVGGFVAVLYTEL